MSKKKEFDPGDLSSSEEEDEKEDLTKKVLEPLLNNNNSCYADSVLMALFQVQNLWMEFLFTFMPLTKTEKVMDGSKKPDFAFRRKFQKLLHMFVCVLRGKKQGKAAQVVKQIQSQISECHLFMKVGQQQDASEFLCSIVEILQLDQNVNRLLTTVYATNDLLNKEPIFLTLTSSRTETAGFVLHRTLPWTELDSVSSFFLTVQDSGVLTNPLRMNGNHFSRIITCSEFVPQSCFVVFCDRTIRSKNDEPDRSPLLIEPTIQHKDRCFFLHSLVMHKGQLNGGHYSSILFNPKQNVWILYDGVNSQQPLRNFDSFTECVKITQAAQCATLLFYSL